MHDLRMPRRSFAAMMIGGMLAAAPVSWAAAPPEAASCVACHGADGMGNAAAGYPRLAGLPAKYIADQLRYFADGTRNNAIMSGMAKPLSQAQIGVLATYYAGLKPSGKPAPMPAGAAASEGERLALRGDWDKGIPACIRCHGPGAVGVGENFPPLVGQSAAYIEAQIKAWKDGSRRGDPLGMMHTVALRMSDAQTQDVAQWLAAQPLLPVKTSKAQP
ncbi:c-type cytochrome [Thiomonas bhubaneswarensis]|uniref:Cytochrome c553 n=1 Tax=Thiomonas bhubaneswarensis TaxID=339866 RepID=A0A0K6ICL4_9BURK|nr:c-type cytochrome [Thiomonas bhubaneswarensis]CUB00850.1 Cytochrome c553 [Thiomonas bhubaneswarensis]